MSVHESQTRIATLESKLQAANRELESANRVLKTAHCEIESVNREIESAKGELKSAHQEIEWAHLKIRVLEERLRQRRVQLLGTFSETLSDLKLELLPEQEPIASGEEVEAEARREPLPSKPARERKPHPGRRPLPETLPRVEQVIGCAEAQCKTCGSETQIIGYDESEV